MSKITAKPDENTESEEAKVIDYLQKNPEVLVSYPEVFTALSIPHHGGDVVSLVERQLKILRGENQALKKKLSELVSIARENEELNQRFHRLSMELMNADQLHDVLAMVQDQVQTFFYTDYVRFKFLPGISDKKNSLSAHYLDEESEIIGTIQPWLEKRKPVCGKIEEKVYCELFGADIKIESCALVPLYHTGELGLLCLGSSSKERFNREMGTIFLEQLGELVSARIQGLLGA
jgi:uncharacterized protein YigA (DUF484 family)